MNDDRLNDLRAGYDRVAAEYAVRIGGELAVKPFDRTILDRFATLTRPLGPVADLGCGPGHVAAYLHDRGIDVIGIDLSPAMIEQARTLNPEIPFRQGSMLEIEENGTLGGIVAFYSVIHVARDEQPRLFTRWRRALQPGGLLLLSFHIGESDRHLDELWGIPVSIDFLYFTRAEIETRLTEGGFAIAESHERDPYPDVEVETRRAYILARNPAQPVSKS